MAEPSGYLSYGGAAEPPRLPRPGHLLGQVSGAQTRLETFARGSAASQSVTIVGFRLCPVGGGAPVDVELRGSTVHGMVRDGDWVELAQPSQPGLIGARQVTNVSTGTVVTASGDPRHPTPVGRAVGIVVLTVFVALFLVIVGMVVVGFFVTSP